jgi:hypothetical protein
VKEIAPWHSMVAVRWLQFDGCSLQRVGREAPSPDPLNYRCAGMAKGGMSSVVRLAEKPPASLYASNVAAPHLRRAHEAR